MLHKIAPMSIEDPERHRLDAWLEDRAARQFRRQFAQGTLLLRRGKPNDALPLLKRAYELRPDDADAALNLGGAYIMSGRHRLAVPVLEAAVERSPDHVRLWINLGAAYLGNPITATDERQTKALGAFRRALQLDPFAPSVAYNIGLIHRDRGEIPEAVAAFRRATMSDPGDADAQRILARLEALGGSAQRA